MVKYFNPNWFFIEEFVITMRVYKTTFLLSISMPNSLLQQFSCRNLTNLNKKISNFKLMTKYPTIFGYWLFYVTHCDTPKMHNSKFVFCNKRSWSQENFPTRGSWTATFTVSLPVLDPLIESHSIDSDLNDSGLELHVLLELLLAFTNFISLVFHINQIYMKYWS